MTDNIKPVFAQYSCASVTSVMCVFVKSLRNSASALKIRDPFCLSGRLGCWWASTGKQLSPLSVLAGVCWRKHKNVFTFCTISQYRDIMWWDSFLLKDNNLFILHGQYQGSWSPGNAMSQGINSRHIDLASSVILDHQHQRGYSLYNMMNTEMIVKIWNMRHKLKWKFSAKSSSLYWYHILHLLE